MSRLQNISRRVREEIETEIRRDGLVSLIALEGCLNMVRQKVKSQLKRQDLLNVKNFELERVPFATSDLQIRYPLRGSPQNTGGVVI